MRVLCPRQSQRGGGDSASDQESGGKGRAPPVSHFCFTLRIDWWINWSFEIEKVNKLKFLLYKKFKTPWAVYLYFQLRFEKLELYVHVRKIRVNGVYRSLAFVGRWFHVGMFVSFIDLVFGSAGIIYLKHGGKHISWTQVHDFSFRSSFFIFFYPFTKVKQHSRITENTRNSSCSNCLNICETCCLRCLIVLPFYPAWSKYFVC